MLLQGVPSLDSLSPCLDLAAMGHEHMTTGHQIHVTY